MKAGAAVGGAVAIVCSLALDASTLAGLPGDVILNEVHADPDAAGGDANGDGSVDSSDDEFVELVNISGHAVDLTGWTLSDGQSVRHTFPSKSIVPHLCSILVFGGGSPKGRFGSSLVQTASTGQLGLGDSGDTVTLNDGASDIASYTYGGEGGDDQSLTRNPDITGPDPLIKHSVAMGSGGALFSPGTRVDGARFFGCLAARMLINEVDSDTPGTDVLELVELYDGGYGSTPLQGLVVVLFDGSDDASYAAFDLDGYMTDADGYFVLGSAGVSGVDLTLADGTLQNGPDAVALYAASASDFPGDTASTTQDLLDAVVYDTADADDPGLLALLEPGQPQVDENGGGDGDVVSSQRCPNGVGGQRRSDAYRQDVPSPGATNTCVEILEDGFESGDLGAWTTSVP